MKLNFFFVITLLSLFMLPLCAVSYAAIMQGCRATANGGTSSIYYVRDGFYNSTIPQFRNDNFTNRYQAGDVYCYRTLGAHGTCYIQGYGGPDSALGTLISFSLNPLDCALDDFIPWLILPVGIGMFFYFRKRRFAPS